MTHTSQTLLDGVLRQASDGLIADSLTLQSVTATIDGDGIVLAGDATKGDVSVSVKAPVAGVEALLALVAASLNAAAPKATPTRRAPAARAAGKPESKPAAAAEPEPKPVAAETVAEPEPVVASDEEVVDPNYPGGDTF